MKIKNLKRNLVLSALVSASALSLTMKTEKEALGMAMENHVNSALYTDKFIFPINNNTINYGNFIPDYIAELTHRRDSIIERQNTLDSLLNDARKTLGISLLHDPMYEALLINQTIDYTLMRPKINQEALVDKILDTLNTGSEVVDKYFIKASIKEESSYDPNISSKAKAQGLLQLMKDTWSVFGEGSYSKNVHNPLKNVRAGVKYYLWLEQFMSKEYTGWNDASLENKRGLLLAAYNGGHNRLKHRKFNIQNMPEESRKHVVKVNNTMAELRAEDLFKQLALYRGDTPINLSNSSPQNYLAYVGFNK